MLRHPTSSGTAARGANRPSAPPLIDQIGHACRPPGLIAGAEPCTRVAVEVLVEQQAVSPQRIGLEFRDIAINRPPSIGAPSEESDHSLGKFAGNVMWSHVSVDGSGSRND